MQNNNFNKPYYGQAYPNYINDNRYAFVNGIEGAKAYQIMPGSSIMLMDSDSPTVFMKNSDASGRSTLRYFKLTEVKEEDLKLENSQNQNDTLKDTIDNLIKKVDSLSAKVDKINKKSEVN